MIKKVASSIFPLYNAGNRPRYRKQSGNMSR